MVKVIDNFIPDREFQQIQSTITGDWFAWFLNAGIDDIGDGKQQFTNSIYSDYEWKCDPDFIRPLIDKIQPLAINRIKVNLLTPTATIERNNFHTDVPPDSGFITAVYYINSNDGKTIFMSGREVESVENRIVLFNSSELHTGTTSTENRFVLNMNFIQDPQIPWVRR
jgi:hypothetical protein